MHHPFASQSPAASHGGTRKNDGTTTSGSPTPRCRVHVAVVDGVVLLEGARARRRGGSSSSSDDDNDNDDDVSSRASSVSLASSPVKYIIAALEKQQQQRCDKEDAKSNDIGGRSSLLSFDDYDSSSVLNCENDNNHDDDVDGDDYDDEVTDVSCLQTGASVFHLPTTTTTTPPAAAAVAPPPSSETAHGGIMTATTTTTDDREYYSTEDEESTTFAMSSACDPINLGHRTIHTVSILALTRSNDPLDYSNVVRRCGGGGDNNGNTVVTTIGPLGDELSYADATSNDNRRGAGQAELLAADEEENRGRGNYNNILDDSRDDDDDEYDNYFGLTNLIAYSSKRVKIVLVTTVAFIVGMLVLTMVFSATASYSSDGFDGTTTVAALGESTSIEGGTEETTIALMTTDDITTTTIPTVYPSLLPSTTSLPSYTPSMSSLPTVTNLPSNIPTVTISPSITTSPSFEPTTMLSNNNMLVLDQVDETVGGKISFYLMADGGSRIKYWSSMLANLSILNNHAFLVHL